MIDFKHFTDKKKMFLSLRSSFYCLQVAYGVAEVAIICDVHS